jgi:8-oxo-dGTP pyrophosphatase MutT (NUDIX family)
MYKVFFNDRVLVISNSWDRAFADPCAIVRKITKKSDIPALVRLFLETPDMQVLWLLSEHPAALMEELPGLFHCVEAAGGLVQNAQQQWLMIYRYNHWDLPKGHCEAGETREETALREVAEECGLAGLQLLHPLTATYHIYREREQFVLKRTHWFAMRHAGEAAPVPQAAESIDKAEWKSPCELASLWPEMYGSIVEVFRAAGLAATF